MPTVTKYLIVNKGDISGPNVNKCMLFEHICNIFEYLIYKIWVWQHTQTLP